MRLIDFIKHEENLVQQTSVISGNLNISDIALEDVSMLGDKISILDKNENIVGEIDKKDLLYLVKQNNKLNLERILDYIEEGIVAIDENGRIYYMNYAYSQILGVPLYRILGKYMQKIESGAILNKVLETREPIYKEKQLILSINKYVSLKILPQFSKGRFIGAISIFKDITELNSMNQEVKRMSEVIEEYSQKLDSQQAFKNLGIITQNTKFLKILEVANIAAQTDATILIRGESGVGKEVLAKLVHSSSDRRNQPLITVNCAAIPDNLFESELFGYESGSFTGANKNGKIGKFQLANKGTIFLDEIGDLPIAMQAKLLRVLQQNEIEKIGAQSPIPVDVRVITATNKPLEKLMKEDRFREDLFFRLNVISLNIPPLRDRKEDIYLLANHFLKIYNKMYNRDLKILPNDYNYMMQYNWPGNIRQLQNCIERSVILGIEALYQTIDLKHKDSIYQEERNVDLEEDFISLKDSMQDYEKAIIMKILEKVQGDKNKAVQILNISKRTFYRKCKELNIMT
ncbi:sigma-54 interaction domain-containing protein [Fusobacterium sp. PH5-44]|uniref:sigma-54 interaction domain-containing protein n=1 Tax=unclassified Fusobacterium TaxID=2648384 RepID=UPI003D25749D